MSGPEERLTPAAMAARLPVAESWDCHTHIFDDPARYPLRERLAYEVPNASNAAALRRMHRALGIDRGVITHTGAYGADHRILLDALRGMPGYRGIGLVDDATTDRALREMHEAGVCGVRFNFLSILKAAPNPASFRRTVARIAEYGWHIRLHAPSATWLEHDCLFREVRVPVVVDHFAYADVPSGPSHPLARHMLSRIRGEGWWVLACCGDRISRQATGWSDVVELAQAFVAAAPDRSIWGSDWPHVHYTKGAPPADAELFDLLHRVVPDDGLRHRILSVNPARLHGSEISRR